MSESLFLKLQTFTLFNMTANGQDTNKIPSVYHTRYHMKYLNSKEMKLNTTGYHDYLKGLYMYIFL